MGEIRHARNKNRGHKSSHGSTFLDPRGRATYGIAICGRCSRKFFLDELFPDPNSPGLMVCEADLDVLDPYRLPPRQTDNIALPFVRPDVPVDDGVPATAPSYDTTLWLADSFGNEIATATGGGWDSGTWILAVGIGVIPATEP